MLLHLYDRDGADMVDRLRGMYTFALWDEARGGMLLARDPFGIKPLYVADDGRTLRVASQVKALLAGGRIDTAPEPAGHVGFFLWGNVPDPFTLYHGIRALPAGATMWIDRQRSHPVRPFFDAAKILAEAEPGSGGPGGTLGAAARCAARFGSPPPHRRCPGRGLPVGGPRFDRDRRPGHGAGGHAPQHGHPRLPRVRGRRQ